VQKNTCYNNNNKGKKRIWSSIKKNKNSMALKKSQKKTLHQFISMDLNKNSNKKKKKIIKQVKREDFDGPMCLAY